ncbi:unnamed protein product, partial [Durusdinium trenchii]
KGVFDIHRHNTALKSPRRATCSMESTVWRCKSMLEAAESTSEQLKAALQDLRALGELSTQVLAETKIGLAVNRLSKEAGDEVRDMAKCLVQDWKQLHRKRKGTEVSESPKKAARPEAVATPKKAPQAAARVKVLEKLQDALKEAALRFGRAAVDGLAEQVEEELHRKFALEQSEKLYLNQSRTILFNLKDAKNQTFASKLLEGELSPSELPNMSSEEMASDQTSQRRAEQRLQALHSSAVKEESGQITDAYTCEQCKGKTCSFIVVTPTACVNGEHSWTSVTCLSCGHRWKA